MERSSAARIPTMWGPFTAYCYKSILDGIEHIAMVKVRAMLSKPSPVGFACQNLICLKLCGRERLVTVKTF